jgi:hypothetical protein
MKRLAGVFLVVTSHAFASTDPFECVDPDVAAAFLGSWHQDQPAFSTTIPEDFVTLSVPDGFVVVGSQSSSSHRSVVYKTDEDDPATAMSNSLDALRKDGWALVEQNLRGGFAGFQTHTRPSTRVVCRDSDPGVMNVTSAERAGETLISFGIYAQHASQTCADMSEKHGALLGRMSLSEHMPSLTLPSGAKTTEMGMGGSGDEMSSRVIVHSNHSREELLGVLGEQVRNQDWRYDSGWSGSVSSGSVWSLSNEDGPIVGVLRITEASSAVFNIRFSMSPVSVDKRAFSAGSFSSSSR